jgi:hypothetical protein
MRKKPTRGRRMANVVAESLDPDAMANLEPEEEKMEPETQHHQRRDVLVEEQQQVGVEETDFYRVSSGMCLNCGRKGHAASNCPEPAKVGGFSRKDGSSAPAERSL